MMRTTNLALAGLTLGLALTGNADAATWYAITSTNANNTYYFFDRETIIKQPGSVILWVKSVNTGDHPDSDGSYSTAAKYTYLCSKRTIQVLMEVSYDKQHTFMRTRNKPGPITEIIPGSVGEVMYKIFCSPSFPADKADSYVKVGNNDIFAAAEFMEGFSNDPAPK